MLDPKQLYITLSVVNMVLYPFLIVCVASYEGLLALLLFIVFLAIFAIQMYLLDKF